MAANAARKKIVVFGGSGFLGSRICEAAVARGWETTSVSRSGAPNWSTITASPTAPAWSQSVAWESANLFQPRSYLPLLHGATAVVHSTGVLLEADYKGVLQGREPVIAGLRRAFSAQMAQRTPNPLRPRGGGAGGEEGQAERRADLTSEELSLDEVDLSPADGSHLTYELMNRDTAIVLARSCAALSASAATNPSGEKTSTPQQQEPPRFIYISAAASFPVLPARYLTTKRDTEAVLTSKYAALRPAFIRAPFLCSPDRAFTMPLAWATAAGAAVNTLTAGVFSGLLGAGGVKALRVEEVGAAVVQAAAEEATTGVVEGNGLKELVTRGWREGML